MSKGISVAARNSKGRVLQQRVRDAILEKFPELEPDDCRSTSMGMGGEDLQLSPAARKRFSYSVECKRYKSFAVYSFYEQAKANSMGYEPLVVIQGDRKKPLALVDFDHFMELVSK